jgi:hypothetical protein
MMRRRIRGSWGTFGFEGANRTVGWKDQHGKGINVGYVASSVPPHLVTFHHSCRDIRHSRTHARGIRDVAHFLAVGLGTSTNIPSSLIDTTVDVAVVRIELHNRIVSKCKIGYG